MKTEENKDKSIQVYIVDSNSASVKDLRSYLQARFENYIQISSFYNGQSALKKVSEETNLVLLDFDKAGENGNEVVKSIKKKSPKTKVILLSSKEDAGMEIESFRKGANDVVSKGNQALNKIEQHVYNLMSYPVRFMVQELRVSKLLSISLLSFITLGIAIELVLNLRH